VRTDQGAGCGRDPSPRNRSVERKSSQGDRREIGVGIGVHLGEAFIGVVGGEHRMEFTVLGDVVNVAQRLTEVAREIDAPIVASATLLERARADRTRQWARIAKSNFTRPPCTDPRLCEEGNLNRILGE
jgi:adenylate cyclase